MNNIDYEKLYVKEPKEIADFLIGDMMKFSAKSKSPETYSKVMEWRYILMKMEGKLK